nr:hypothetical protein HmN_000258800 [Hymenolepis microstoma]
MNMKTKSNNITERTTAEPSILTTEKTASITTVEPTTFFTTQGTSSSTEFTGIVTAKMTTTKSKIEKSEERKGNKIRKNRYNQQRILKNEPVLYYPEMSDPVLFPIIPQYMNQINPIEYQLLKPLPEYDQLFQWHYEPWPEVHYNSWEDSNWLASFKDRERKPNSYKCKNKKKEPKKYQFKMVTETTEKSISLPINTEPQTTTTEEIPKITLPPLFQETLNEIVMLVDEHLTQLRSESNKDIRKLLAKRMKATLEDGANHIKNLLSNDAYAGN